jgi:hypothetical protein
MGAIYRTRMFRRQFLALALVVAFVAASPKGR